MIDIAIRYIFDGMVGGVLYIFVTKYGWNEKYEAVRRLGIGAIAGYIVYVAGLPNSFTALSLGYLGIDVIEALMNKYKKI